MKIKKIITTAAFVLTLSVCSLQPTLTAAASNQICSAEQYGDTITPRAHIKKWIYKIEDGKNISGFTMLLLILGKLTGYILVMFRMICFKLQDKVNAFVQSSEAAGKLLPAVSEQISVFLRCRYKSNL